MKIDTSRISPEGISLSENFSARDLDLDTEIIKFRGPIRARAEVSKIANALTVHLSIKGTLSAICGRCLNDFETELNKNMDLNYPANRLEPVIDLDPEIREEIILDYPIKPLCKVNCKGLCHKCGKNLNEGGCSCAIT